MTQKSLLRGESVSSPLRQTYQDFGAFLEFLLGRCVSPDADTVSVSRRDDTQAKESLGTLRGLYEGLLETALWWMEIRFTQRPCVAGGAAAAVREQPGVRDAAGDGAAAVGGRGVAERATGEESAGADSGVRGADAGGRWREE